jgi:hypothetical protein
MVASATSGSWRPPPGALSTLCDNHPSGVATRRPGPVARQATTIGPLPRLLQKAFAPSQTIWSIEYLPARTRIRKSRSQGRVIVPSARSSLHSYSSRKASMAACTSYPNFCSISGRCPLLPRPLLPVIRFPLVVGESPERFHKTSGKKNMPVAHNFRPDGTADSVPGKQEVQRQGIAFTSQPGPFLRAKRACYPHHADHCGGPSRLSTTRNAVRTRAREPSPAARWRRHRCRDRRCREPRCRAPRRRATRLRATRRRPRIR